MKFKVLILILSLSLGSNLMADDMDPISWGVALGVGATAGILIGTAGVESFNILTQDNTITNTMDTSVTDNTLTTTNEGN